MSESIETYLVMITMLRRDSAPVALTRLAESLTISSVSTNEMCRKLEERGLVVYQPYKGVTLTGEGEAIAQQVLSRRRLWMAFLIENLQVAPDEANILACRLAHVTSENLAGALTVFLAQTQPANAGALPAHIDVIAADDVAQPFTSIPPGGRGQIRGIHADKGLCDLLAAQGIHPNATVEVLMINRNGVVTVQVGQQQIALAPIVAACIEVVPLPTQRLSLLRCAQDMCQGFWLCLKRHERPTTQSDTPCLHLLPDNQDAIA